MKLTRNRGSSWQEYLFTIKSDIASEHSVLGGTLLQIIYSTHLDTSITTAMYILINARK